MSAMFPPMDWLSYQPWPLYLPPIQVRKMYLGRHGRHFPSTLSPTLTISLAADPYSTRQVRNMGPFCRAIDISSRLLLYCHSTYLMSSVLAFTIRLPLRSYLVISLYLSLTLSSLFFLEVVPLLPLGYHHFLITTSNKLDSSYQSLGTLYLTRASTL